MICAVLGCAATATGQETGRSVDTEVRPLAIEDALRTRSLGLYAPPQVTPDGGQVAYTVHDPSRRGPTQTGLRDALSRNGDVYISDTRSGESRNLSAGVGNSWYPAWSPDGRLLAFYSDRSGDPALWIWDRESDALRRASPATVVPIGLQWPKWTPDGRHLIVPVLASGADLDDLQAVHQQEASVETGSPTVTVYTSDGSRLPPDSAGEGAVGRGSTRPRPKDLAVVDVRTGDTRYLGLSPQVGGNLGWFQPSPDGAKLAFTTMMGLAMTHDIFIVDLTSLHLARVASGVPMWLAGATVSWSPDGQWLAYTTYGGIADGECYLVHASGGGPRRLTRMPHPSFGSEFHPPLWDPSGESLYFLGADTLWRVGRRNGVVAAVASMPGRKLRNIVSASDGATLWSPDGSSIVLETNHSKAERSGFYLVDQTSGRAEPLLEEDRSYGLGPHSFPSYGTSRATNQLIFPAQDADSPEELWLLNASSGRARQISRVQEGLLDYVYGKAQLIKWRAPTGDTLRGALLLPAGYQTGRRYPLLVYPYGGSRRSTEVHSFGLAGHGVENMQLFATRGYAVLLPDTRLRADSLVPDLVGQVVTGVDAVVEMGVADRARVGVMGHSFGGYNTVAIIAVSNRFRAAVARAGFGSTLGMYGEMRNGSPVDAMLYERPPRDGYIEPGLGNVGVPPWARFDLYLANTPLFHLTGVETPLLLVHGSDDRRVPERYSAELYVWLSRMGKEVSFARYVGEDHTERYWSYANQVDYIGRVLDWFERHLNGADGNRITAAPARREPA
jgi:dipeptidyl aminopeptidase/acylaminoacyl peptidase